MNKNAIRLLAAAVLLLLIADSFALPERQVSARGAILAIRIYQSTYGRMLSTFHLARCKFTPSCSNYGILAYQKYGVFKGTYLTARRLARCSPFSRARGEDWP